MTCCISTASCAYRHNPVIRKHPRRNTHTAVLLFITRLPAQSVLKIDPSRLLCSATMQFQMRWDMLDGMSHLIQLVPRPATADALSATENVDECALSL